MRTLNIAHDFTNTYTQILPTCNNLFFHWYSRRIDIEYICRAYVLYSKYALTSRVVAKRYRDGLYPLCRTIDERTPSVVVVHAFPVYSSYSIRRTIEQKIYANEQIEKKKEDKRKTKRKVVRSGLKCDEEREDGCRGILSRSRRRWCSQFQYRSENSSSVRFYILFL